MTTIVEEEKKDQKCPRCKCYAYPKDFYNSTGRLLKTCRKCRESTRKSNEKNKCEHNRQKHLCNECGGTSMCEHGKRRDLCIDCEGASICEHGRQRCLCKICSDPVKITIYGWIKHSRQKDKKYNRYDANNFIDKCFLQGLVEDYSHCCYCKIKMQYIVFQDDLATIERIDNKLGHIKSNCVLACKKCNVSRIGDSK